MNFSKLVQGIFIVVFAAIVLWGITFFVQMQRELKALRAQEAANQKRLNEAEAKLKEQETYLYRLKNDPSLVEQLIRRKLGYVRGEEFVFRFEDETAK